MKYHDRKSLPAHGEKGQLMVAGGQFMAKNDGLWPIPEIRRQPLRNQYKNDSGLSKMA